MIVKLGEETALIPHYLKQQPSSEACTSDECAKSKFSEVYKHVVDGRPTTHAENKLPLKRVCRPASAICVRKADKMVADLVKPPSLLAPGQVISGKWGGGKLTLADGTPGTYSVDPGYQHIQFEFGGYTGHFISPKRAIAFNPKTGEMVSLAVEIGANEFKITNIEDLSAKKFIPCKKDKSDYQGKVDGNVVRFGENGLMTINSDGRIHLRMTDPKCSDKPPFEGQGYIDGRGNLVAVFQNGAVIRANYSRNDHSFGIYNYEVMK